MREFAIEWIAGADYAGVTVPSSSGLKNKLERLAKERPDEVQKKAENKDGSAFFHIPVNYVKVSPPRKISEEQKRAMGERARKMWEEKHAATGNTVKTDADAFQRG